MHTPGSTENKTAAFHSARQNSPRTVLRAAEFALALDQPRTSSSPPSGETARPVLLAHGKRRLLDAFGRPVPGTVDKFLDGHETRMLGFKKKLIGVCTSNREVARRAWCSDAGLDRAASRWIRQAKARLAFGRNQVRGNHAGPVDHGPGSCLPSVSRWRCGSSELKTTDRRMVLRHSVGG